MLYALRACAQPGDIFVQKAPAATVRDLAQALIELTGGKTEVKVIGTRHGEKLFESLVSREEMARAQDLGRYYRIPADSRDLNYDKYFVQGETEISAIDDYTSHNTHRLDVEGVKSVLMKLDVVQEALRMLQGDGRSLAPGRRSSACRASSRCWTSTASTSSCIPGRTTTTS